MLLRLAASIGGGGMDCGLAPQVSSASPRDVVTFVGLVLLFKLSNDVRNFTKSDGYSILRSIAKQLRQHAIQVLGEGCNLRWETLKEVLYAVVIHKWLGCKLLISAGAAMNTKDM